MHPSSGRLIAQKIDVTLGALTKLQGQLVKDLREKGTNLSSINEQFGKALAAFSQRTAQEETTGMFLCSRKFCSDVEDLMCI